MVCVVFAKNFSLSCPSSHGTCKSMKSKKYLLLAGFQVVHDYCGSLQYYYSYHAL